MRRPRATSAIFATASASSSATLRGSASATRGERVAHRGQVKAGESTYTESASTGPPGLLAFCAWLVAVLAALWRRSAWLSAAWVSMLAIGSRQT